MQDLQPIFHEEVNPIALRKTKIAYNFGLSECNKVKIAEPCSTEIGKATSLLELIIYQQNMFRQVSGNHDCCFVKDML